MLAGQVNPLGDIGQGNELLEISRGLDSSPQFAAGETPIEVGLEVLGAESDGVAVVLNGRLELAMRSSAASAGRRLIEHQVSVTLGRLA